MRSLLAMAIVFALAICETQAQEQLYRLTSNPVLRDAIRHGQPAGSARAGDTLSLPFFEDFSEPFSRENFPHDLYPDQQLWIGRSVYVNDHMAVNPLSVGVATFDGLDSTGLAYGFGLTIPTAADTLMSRPIDLSNTQGDVYLSFHYQAQGMGLAPASNDVLELEFKDSAGVWDRVWSAPGYLLQVPDFKRAMIHFDETRHLFKGFQFRFVNYAALAGAVDHWHLDYIYLNDGRSAADTIYRDMALIEGTSNILFELQSIPWDHYKSITESAMDSLRLFRLRNNYNDLLSVRYNFEVRDRSGNVLFLPFTASTDINPSIICGNETVNECGLNQNFGRSLLGFQYPTDESTQLAPDSNYFFLETRLDDLVDNQMSNNKVLHKQRFYNYYAYDDGTAEVGYGLGNLAFPGQVAIKFTTLKRDDLQAIQYYLNPVAEDLTDDPVRFIVWKGNEVPEQMVYMSREINLSYSTGMNYMNHFFFEGNDEFKAPGFPDIDGTFFIGWQQRPVTGQKFSFGFDRENDASDKLFYSIGSSPWTQGVIQGSVMFRPVFGTPYNWSVDAPESMDRPSITAYPNPTEGMVYLNASVEGMLTDAHIAIHDLAGRTVLTQRGYSNGIDANGLSQGMYILNVTDRNGHRHTQRIIVRP